MEASGNEIHQHFHTILYKEDKILDNLVYKYEEFNEYILVDGVLTQKEYENGKKYLMKAKLYALLLWSTYAIIICKENIMENINTFV